MLTVAVFFEISRRQSMGGVRYSAEQWSEWIEQQEFGLTISEFCDAIGIAVHSFYRCRTRLDGERLPSPPPQSPFGPLTQIDTASFEIVFFL